MKYLIKNHIAAFLLVSLAVCTTDGLQAQSKDALSGAWRSTEGSLTQLFVFTDHYFSHTVFDQQHKKFISTRGGECQLSGNGFQVNYQYHSADKTAAGSTQTYPFSLQGNNLVIHLENGVRLTAKQIDNNEGELAGVWRISGRKEGETVNPFPLGDRRTLKILTGTTFQWAAINIKTGEFSGTGGGTYIFKDGKYTEHIEFFSRDNSRVGASLSFDGKLERGEWHHSGLSSTGNPIYEVWSKLSSASR